MDQYDFSTLCPTEFEALVCDLISIEMQLAFRSFKSGKDSGIDLRYASEPSNSVVVQCKHFPHANFASLKAAIRKEKPKVEKLSPTRYVVVTSMGLTPGNADELRSILSPYVTSVGDIISRSDLNSMLRRYPEVERVHSKLWISSTEVLTMLLHNEVFSHTAMTMDLIKRRLSKLVPTKALVRAREKLIADKVCVICGGPGVGKTTAAEMLLVEHVRNGWEPVVITQNVAEAMKVIQTGSRRKQIIYYDDFLGQISDERKLAKNEDSVLLNLIEWVRHSDDKRLLLTTREYILEQAKHFSEKLYRSQLDVLRFTIKCDEYTLKEKALILSNHLYFGGVPKSHIQALIKDKKYRLVVEHANYNPRIIESATNMQLVQCESRHYAKAFIRLLEDPKEIWSHAFEHQLSERARSCLIALAITGENVRINHLETAFNELHEKRCQMRAKDYEFRHALDELDAVSFKFGIPLAIPLTVQRQQRIHRFWTS